MKDLFHIALATMDTVPNWLKADDAERLRSSIDAHRILDGEYQVQCAAVAEKGVVDPRAHAVPADAAGRSASTCAAMPVRITAGPPAGHPVPVQRVSEALDPSTPQQILEDHTILRSEVLPTGDNGVNLPVNLKRLIWNAQQLFKVKPNRKAPSGTSSCSCRPLLCSWLHSTCPVDSV